MKYTNAIILSGVLIWVTGCASPTPVAVLEPIGPRPTQRAQDAGKGSLQVFSARQQADINPTREEWVWNNDFGKNAFLHEPAHTDYDIYSQDGKLLRRVRNARNQDDPIPAVVTLPPGRYDIQAEAEDYPGAALVKVPVVIEAGKTTTAHLMDGWKPRHQYSDHDVVRLPDGEIAGWLATR